MKSYSPMYKGLISNLNVLGSMIPLLPLKNMGFWDPKMHLKNKCFPTSQIRLIQNFVLINWKWFWKIKPVSMLTALITATNTSAALNWYVLEDSCQDYFASYFGHSQSFNHNDTFLNKKFCCISVPELVDYFQFSLSKETYLR